MVPFRLPNSQLSEKLIQMVSKVGIGKKPVFSIYEEKSDFDKSCGGQMKIFQKKKRFSSLSLFGRPIALLCWAVHRASRCGSARPGVHPVPP